MIDSSIFLVSYSWIVLDWRLVTSLDMMSMEFHDYLMYPQQKMLSVVLLLRIYGVVNSVHVGQKCGNSPSAAVE
jgi:hypothetical protein